VKTHSEQHRYSKGQVLVLSALILTVLVGFMGLAVDAGYFFDYRRRMVAAADSAAVAGAMEVKRDPNSTNVVTVARNAAAANSFTHGADDITVTVNRSPASGYHVGNNKFVEVLINRPHPTFFMRALGVRTTTVSARAVAGPGVEMGCIYVLDPSADSALQVNGGAVLKAPTCNVYVNSTGSAALYLAGSGACVLANSVNITGNYSGTTCSTSTPYTGTPPVDDPFANLQPPTIPSTCTYSDQVSVTGVATLNPGRYCNGIAINSGAIATFNPGLYILETASTKKTAMASLSASGQAVLLGTGVTFYLNSGGVSLTGGGSVTLSAPTSGPWEGILFFQNRSNARQSIIAGGNLAQLNGVLYFPQAPLQYGGGSVTTNYTTLVARTLQISGTSLFNNNYASLADGDPITKPMLGE